MHCTLLSWICFHLNKLILLNQNTFYVKSIEMLYRMILSHCVPVCDTVGSGFAKVRFMTFHFYDPCCVGPSTPDLSCFYVATQVSFLYLVHF
jgi:hypothetical protein